MSTMIRKHRGTIVRGISTYRRQIARNCKSPAYIRILAMAALATFTAACTSSEDFARREQEICEQQGTAAGTPEHARCLQLLRHEQLSPHHQAHGVPPQ